MVKPYLFIKEIVNTPKIIIVTHKESNYCKLKVEKKFCNGYMNIHI